VGSFNLILTKEPTVKEVISQVNNALNKRNWSEVVFCGFGEPLERLDCILETVTWVKKHYGKPLRFRIDTNGHGNLLNSDREVIQELKNVGVGTVSVSLNAHDKATYDQVCRPKFKEAFPAVLKFIDEARKCLDVEATAVTIPEIDLSRVEMIAKKMDVKFRVRQYIPNIW
jgi:TatD DNase family protein